MRGLLLVVAALTFTPPAFGQPVDAPLSAGQEQALRASVFVATQAPDFKRGTMLLEVYRTLRGAGVTLTPDEAFEMGEMARWRGNAAEASTAYALMGSDSAEYRKNKYLIADMAKRAEEDRRGEVERSYEAAGKRANSAPALDTVAQAFAAQGDHARAVEIYEQVIAIYAAALKNTPPIETYPPSEAEIKAWAAAQAKSNGRAVQFYLVEAQRNPNVMFGRLPDQVTWTDLALAQLNYGISLLALKRVEDARATWSAIHGSAGAEILAKAWLGIADRSAN